MTFAERLHQRIETLNTRVCLGIDPRPASHPLTDPKRYEGDPAQVAKAVVGYFREIIEATQQLVACYKPQSAFFEVLGIPGMVALAQLIADIKSLGIPVLLDAKRGDIASTAQAYASAYLGDGVFGSDALTVNPYLGMDSLEPFFQAALAHHRGVFVLIKTSNPGGSDFQNVETSDGMYLFDHVAYRLAERARSAVDASGYAPFGAVVGATYWQELAHLREVLPNSILLVPGYGAQGGAAEQLAAAFDALGYGAIVNASRSLTYITQGADFAQQAARATRVMRDAINAAIGLT
jgi:orotidine-5'-phosphate decarboxylase